MIAHQPIPYTLSDPADDVDHGAHPVDSTFYTCCRSIGRHSRECAQRWLAGAPTSAIVAELHRRGFTDADIATQVGCSVGYLKGEQPR